jgi:phosphate starvation-inducible PhoH-like protein
MDPENKKYLTNEQIETFFESPRKKKRREKKEKTAVTQQYNLREVKPITPTQREIFESFFNSEQNLFLHGYAGTGKSFVACYLLLKELLQEGTPFKKIVIIRSTVPSRDQGFLPGSAADKAKVYERPYYSLFEELFNRADAYETFKRKKLVEFESTSYLRGTTFNDCLVLFDEMQNATYNELKTVITRMGENSRLIISGDYLQSDLDSRDKHGVLDIMKILKRMKMVDFFEFTKEDIVRSKFVKQFIITEANYKSETT